TVGDMILFGGWVYSPTKGANSIAGGSSSNVLVDTNSSPHYTLYGSNGSQGTTYLWESSIFDDWWHPVVGYTYVTSADGAASQSVRMQLGCDSTKTLNYWDPWMMVIPASAGYPVAEVLRWRQQLMHSYVPPNAPAGVLAVDPNLLIYPGTQ